MVVCVDTLHFVSPSAAKLHVSTDIQRVKVSSWKVYSAKWEIQSFYIEDVEWI